MIFEYFVSLELRLSQFLLESLFHGIDLALDQGDQLDLIIKKDVRGAGAAFAIIVEGVCIVDKVRDELNLDFSVVYETRLILKRESHEAFGKDVPLGLTILSAVVFEVV